LCPHPKSQVVHSIGMTKMSTNSTAPSTHKSINTIPDN
jgi:hypothetical protein